MQNALKVGLISLASIAAIWATLCTGACEVSPSLVERKKQELAKGDEISKEAAQNETKPIRDFIANKLKMRKERADQLRISVVEDWALARDAKGVEFLCRRVNGTWTLLAAGSKVKLPQDAPWGLAAGAGLSPETLMSVKGNPTLKRETNREVSVDAGRKRP